jgi:hypothetical protein
MVSATTRVDLGIWMRKDGGDDTNTAQRETVNRVLGRLLTKAEFCR